MSKTTPFAREDVMEAYLDSLLTEAPVDPAESSARTEALLKKATEELTQVETVSEAKPELEIDKRVSVSPDDDVVTEVNHAAEMNPTPVSAPSSVADVLEESFQALLFEVAGLTMAVPLTTLGGIHNIDKVGPLIGKPRWFMGVMLHREQKLNVVDTAQWVMPEKYDQKLAETLNYQYLIMLGDSEWGLASDKLINTVTLGKEDVKWRENSGKRPWLAGMVKDKMCALVDVYQLISMLNKGLGSNDV